MSICYSCVATILSDVNCTFKWVLRDNTFSRDFTYFSASTLVECQRGCALDRRCVAVNWRSDRSKCISNRNPNHNHGPSQRWDHYDLVSRCNITSGQCFITNVIANHMLCAVAVSRNSSKSYWGPVWELPGGLGGSTPQFISSTPLVWFIRLSWGSKNNPPQIALVYTVCAIIALAQFLSRHCQRYSIDTA